MAGSTDPTRGFRAKLKSPSRLVLPMNPTRIALFVAALVSVSITAPAGEITIVADRDNSLYSESGSESNGAGAYFFAGTNGFGQIRRGLLRFDVAGALPAGSTVTQAEVNLHMSKTNAGVRDVLLHRALGDWGEGTSNASGEEGSGTGATVNDATWTRRFWNTISWTTPGGDFAATASASIPVDQVGTYVWSSAGLVADVQSWLDSPSTNFGWVVKNVNESDVPTSKRFDSRQNPETSVRPVLRIFFDLPCTTSSANYCVGAPNSTGVGATMGWSGSLSVGANAFTLTCAQLPPNASHVYYFGAAQGQTPFGNGFRCITGTLARLNPPQVATPSGTSSRYVDLLAIPAVGNITAGSTRYFQCWYRNPAGGGAGFNLSDGLGATFCN